MIFQSFIFMLMINSLHSTSTISTSTSNADCFTSVESILISQSIPTIEKTKDNHDDKDKCKMFKFVELSDKNCKDVFCQDLSSSRNIFDTLAKFKNMEKLSLSLIDSLKISKEIKELKKLKQLSLSGNDISSLPNEITELKSLKILNLDENKIQSLPDNIGKLINLQNLTLSWNAISALPASITELKELKHLNLDDNMIENISIEQYNYLKSIKEFHYITQEVKKCKDGFEVKEIKTMDSVTSTICVGRSIDSNPKKKRSSDSNDVDHSASTDLRDNDHNSTARKRSADSHHDNSTLNNSHRSSVDNPRSHKSAHRSSIDMPRSHKSHRSSVDMPRSHKSGNDTYSSLDDIDEGNGSSNTDNNSTDSSMDNDKTTENGTISKNEKVVQLLSLCISFILLIWVH